VRRLRAPSGLAAAMGLAAAAVAIALVTLFALLLVAILSYRDSSTTARHAQQAIASANQLETLALDLETGLRGFIITRKQSSLKPWRDARARYPKQVAEFLRLASDNPRQAELARNVQLAILHYNDTFSLPLLEFMNRNPSLARRFILSAAGLHQLDPIRVGFTKFIDGEQKIADERNATARHTARVAIVLGAVSLGLAVLLIVLLTAYLARRVARPIRLAADAAGRLADGDLTSRVDERGVAEVGALQRAFNSMAASLERGRRELEEQNRKLRESEKVKSELVSSVSHELRTPLASILGFSDLMLQRDLDPADRRRYLELVRGEADRLAALLNDLLDLQRIEEAGVRLTREELDLSKLLESQVVLYSAQSDRHALDLETDEGCIVLADRDRLAQVVGNLFSNAIKYSPDGGVVHIEARCSGARVRVTVRDDGMGIPLVQQRQIFTKFFRGDAGRRLGIGGTGLGLALARDIVEAHGGRIGFESLEDRGSTFWFDLPLAPADERRGAGVSDSRRRGGSP
jgi:signal transduction histidine kinase